MRGFRFHRNANIFELVVVIIMISIPATIFVLALLGKLENRPSFPTPTTTGVKTAYPKVGDYVMTIPKPGSANNKIGHGAWKVVKVGNGLVLRGLEWGDDGNFLLKIIDHDLTLQDLKSETTFVDFRLIPREFPGVDTMDKDFQKLIKLIELIDYQMTRIRQHSTTSAGWFFF